MAARLSARFEMYGNGWAGSTASGVSTGKMRSSNTSERYCRSSSAEFLPVHHGHALLAQRGEHLAQQQLLLLRRQRGRPDR
jgi:hypothetical protein